MCGLILHSISKDSPPRWSNLSQQAPTSTPPNPIGATQTAALKTQPVTKPPNPAKNQILNALKSIFRAEDDKAKKSTRAPPVKPTKARGPTDPPFIGDSYMTENVPPQTNCPDGIQSRIKQSEFGGRFLEHIPVLQWAQHVTQEQHQRLKRYPGTHGWGGVDYNSEIVLFHSFLKLTGLCVGKFPKVSHSCLASRVTWFRGQLLTTGKTTFAEIEHCLMPQKDFML
ncbi:hypothetical protein XENORESO_004091 [Xenotaenia resolanae]|uniref:Uncharacterized protein n=1 Tax=Xenotaenia resolanae TaxID=208358 RepID=A0ABV0WQW4_9TELE